MSRGWMVVKFVRQICQLISMDQTESADHERALRHHQRALVVSRIAIDIRYLKRNGLLVPRNIFTMCWSSDRSGLLPGEVLVTVGGNTSLHIKHFGAAMPSEVLDITQTRCHLGGRRSWFICSKLGCGKRVAILYATEQGFRCRHCAKLAYESQREQPRDRAIRRARNNRRQVDGGNNLADPFPPKPKGMHWSTYDRCLRKEMDFWNGYSCSPSPR